jgi:hypothetical protein
LHLKGDYSIWKRNFKLQLSEREVSRAEEGQAGRILEGKKVSVK